MTRLKSGDIVTVDQKPYGCECECEYDPKRKYVVSTWSRSGNVIDEVGDVHLRCPGCGICCAPREHVHLAEPDPHDEEY